MSAIDWNALKEQSEKIRASAYAPYSNYYVGAALLSDDGRVFVGCNVENASYGLCMCAERSAISAAVSAGVKAFVALAVSSQGPEPATPCGMCRQVLAEFPPNFEIRCYAPGGRELVTSVTELLPYAFGPSISASPMNGNSNILLRGGTVVTMNPARQVLRADVLVENGRIAAIGPSIQPSRTVRLIDVKGQAILPGLIQAHVHLCQSLFRGMADDLPLMAWLKQRIWPLEAAHDRASLRASVRMGISEMLLSGTTCLLDMGTTHHHDAVFEMLDESGIRAFSGKAMMDAGAGVPAGLRETTKKSIEESERLRRRWHGKSGDRLRYAYAPRFILSCSEKLLREVAKLSEANDVLIHTHAAEQVQERELVREMVGKDDVEALRAAGIFGPRAVFAHCVQLRRDEMRKMGKEGTRAVHCPSSNLKLASGIANVPMMREHGIVVALGHDGAPCSNRTDAWTELRQTALLAKVANRNAAALPAMEALAIATIEGAKVLGIDRDVGSIEVGKKADLISVDMHGLHTTPDVDVVSKLVYATLPTDVRSVIVDGQLLVSDSQLVRWDVDEVRESAEKQAKKVLRRAGLK